MFESTIRGLFAAVAVATLSIAAFGQSSTRDNYLISAEAGGVNFAEGAATIVRQDHTSGRLLKGDRIQVGDRVATGADGRVEVLLNPGSYLRLGADSRFSFRTTSLDDLKLNVDRGSAMLEVFATRDFTVTIFTPKGQAKIIESGIYRIDVAANGSGSLKVWDGLAMVSGLEVKSGRMTPIDRTLVSVTKFDRDQKDELAVWSKQRGKLIAKNTSKLKNQSVRASLISAFDSGRWGMWNSFGVWVFDPFFGGNCFLPFGRYWYSPYGYGYGSSIWWYNLPPIYYQPTPTTPTIPNPNPGTTPDPYGTRSRTGRQGGMDDAAPPYVRLEETGRQNNPIRNLPVEDRNGTRQSAPPIFIPPPIIVIKSDDTGARQRP
ncbi:MAG: FecR domain-containing protein [Acidobacteria bacterium]|nr:FecR domain-containing protein [Acidobacteriota bacterium]